MKGELLVAVALAEGRRDVVAAVVDDRSVDLTRLVAHLAPADGERKRVTVRGSEVSDETRQINATVVDDGGNDVAATLGESDGDE